MIIIWGEVKMNNFNKELSILKQENERLRLEEEKYKTYFMMAKTGIALLDLESNFLSVNPAYIEMSGYTQKELQQTSCIELSIEEDVPRSIAVIKKVIKEGYVENYEKTCKLKDNKLKVVHMSLALLPDKKTILINVIDITERRRLEQELYQEKEKFKKQAYTDTLTNISNRMAFNDYIAKTVYKKKERKEKFLLLYLDLDKFKGINDTYGHSLGDSVLIEFTSKIKEILKPSDFFARIGGDEFSIIIEDPNAVDSIINDIKHVLLNMDIIENIPIKLTTSIGISMYPDDAKNCKDLLIAADRAMYKAKTIEGTSISDCGDRY